MISQTAIHNLAELYYHSGKARAASQYYEKYIDLNPDDTNTLNQIALAYTEIGEMRKSHDMLKKSLEINPEQVETRKIFSELENIISQTTAEAKPDTIQNKSNVLQNGSGSECKSNFNTDNQVRFISQAG